MGFFSDIAGDFHDLSTPWRFSGNEWKQKVRNSEFGSPIHGLKAGESIHNMMSPTKHIYDRIGRLRDGEDFFSKEHIEGTYKDNHHYIQDAFKENWPVLLAYLGGAGLGAGGGGGGGGAAGGAGGGGAVAAEGGGGLALDAAGGITYAGAPGAVALEGGGSAAYAGGAAAGGGGSFLSNLSQGLGALGGSGNSGQGGAGYENPQMQSQRQMTPIAATNPNVNSRGLGMNGQAQMDPQLLAQLVRQLMPASGGYV